MSKEKQITFMADFPEDKEEIIDLLQAIVNSGSFKNELHKTNSGNNSFTLNVFKLEQGLGEAQAKGNWTCGGSGGMDWDSDGKPGKGSIKVGCTLSGSF